MSVNSGVKIAVGVDRIHQFADYRGAGPALIAGVGGQDGPPIVVEAVERHHVSGLVVVHRDLRVDAQQHGTHAAVSGLLERGGGAAGTAGGHSRAGAVSAGGQGGQGKGSGQGQSKQLGGNILFHFIHLKKYSLFCVLC